ncbi:staygreen family protein [Bacillus norwichensis]|uniref:Staygreen protein domain-containing protein n=1 Tax=Bacillus norwichensis TaxID=2762217 RepID=A0ABR8VJX8_9BACI|nr:staygreen family protein [Bacillus norwichensis]MBD8005084.1 hypothetical protein [Bacillus norwichensis]
MEKFQLDEFSVAILPPATTYHPVDGRKYTLIMSTDETNSHLAIGYKYEMSLLHSENKSMLTAEWKPSLGEYILSGKIHPGIKQSSNSNRSHQTQPEVTKAVSMIVKADKDLFAHVPWLLYAPIYIETESNIHKYRAIQFLGVPKQYLIL